VQLTNAGLEICWKRAVRMHWRAGAAKVRPASIMRNVYACREGIWERALVLVVLTSQKQQSAKQSQHHARRLAADAVVARFLPPPRAKADLPTCSGDWQDCSSTTLLYHHTLPRWTDSRITTTSRYLQSVDVYEDMTCSQPANQSMHSSQCG
jgi:hypothetical protein